MCPDFPPHPFPSALSILLQLSSSLSPWDPAPFESPGNQLRLGSPRPLPPRPRWLRVAASLLSVRPPAVPAAPFPPRLSPPHLLLLLKPRPPPCPLPSHSGAHSRPASRACVCEPVLGRRRPVCGGGGRLRAGGSPERVQPPPPGAPDCSRAEDRGGPGHKPRPQRILVPPWPAAILSQAIGLSSQGWL